MYPVTTALQFLQEQTYLNTDNATGLEDPHFSGTVLVEHLTDQDGDPCSAIVYLDDTGNEQHDFEKVEVECVPTQGGVVGETKMKIPRINDDMLTNPPSKYNTLKELRRIQYPLARKLIRLVLAGEGGSDEAQNLAYDLIPILTILGDDDV